MASRCGSRGFVSLMLSIVIGVGPKSQTCSHVGPAKGGQASAGRLTRPLTLSSAFEGQRRPRFCKLYLAVLLRIVMCRCDAYVPFAAPPDTRRGRERPNHEEQESHWDSHWRRRLPGAERRDPRRGQDRRPAGVRHGRVSPRQPAGESAHSRRPMTARAGQSAKRRIPDGVVLTCRFVALISQPGRPRPLSFRPQPYDLRRDLRTFRKSVAAAFGRPCKLGRCARGTESRPRSSF